MSQYFLGVDAGNSKTVALLVDQTGSVLGRGRAGNGDIYGAGSPEAATRAVLAAADEALDAAGLTRPDVHHAAFRLAGVDWPEDERLWQQALTSAFADGGTFSVRNDGYALLRCGRPDGVGVAVTAGTGPAVAARGPSGREWCASWWIQHRLGGQGLGVAAFRAVIDAESGVGPPTLLTLRLLQHYTCSDVETLLHAFTRRDHPIDEREKRSTARQVLQTATDGDAVAGGLIDQQVKVFAELVRVAAYRTGLAAWDEDLPVALGGSVLTSELPIFRERLIAAMADRLGPVEVVSSAAAPVAGAALDALAEAGVVTDAGVRDRILSAVHPPQFLLT